MKFNIGDVVKLIAGGYESASPEVYSGLDTCNYNTEYIITGFKTIHTTIWYSIIERNNWITEAGLELVKKSESSFRDLYFKVESQIQYDNALKALSLLGEPITSAYLGWDSSWTYICFINGEWRLAESKDRKHRLFTPLSSILPENVCNPEHIYKIGDYVELLKSDNSDFIVGESYKIKEISSATINVEGKNYNWWFALNSIKPSSKKESKYHIGDRLKICNKGEDKEPGWLIQDTNQYEYVSGVADEDGKVTHIVFREDRNEFFYKLDNKDLSSGLVAESALIFISGKEPFTDSSPKFKKGDLVEVCESGEDNGYGYYQNGDYEEIIDVGETVFTVDVTKWHKERKEWYYTWNGYEVAEHTLSLTSDKIQQARRIYPAGTKFKSAYSDAIVVSTGKIVVSHSNSSDLLVDIDVDTKVFCYYNGKWAKIIIDNPTSNKFKVGDIIIGNKEANDEYSITKKGWRGIVKSIVNTNYIKVSELDGTGDMKVLSNCFDLFESKSLVDVKMYHPVEEDECFKHVSRIDPYDFSQTKKKFDEQEFLNKPFNKPLTITIKKKKNEKRIICI